MENLNITREKILMKGYANLKEIGMFIPCGNVVAKNIQSEIVKKVEIEHKTVFKQSGRVKIKASRLLEYIDLTEKQIHQYADIERKST